VTLGQFLDPSLRKTNGRESQRPHRSDLDLIEHADSALEVLHGKWKVHLLCSMARGIHRHGTLLNCLPGVSKKVMTDTLRALERDGLVDRRIFAEVPVRVEYSLTPLGWALAGPLMALADWGKEYGSEVSQARSRYRLADAAPGGRAITTSEPSRAA
jgi:DNA-binding HxlR family transcriptional regulator